MQKQPDLAKNLENLFKDSAYTEFREGDFINQPKMTGYFYIFKNITISNRSINNNISY